MIKIVIDVNFKDLLKKDGVYNCQSSLLNIVEEFTYEYFLKNYLKFIDKDESDNEKNLNASNDSDSSISG